MENDRSEQHLSEHPYPLAELITARVQRTRLALSPWVQRSLRAEERRSGRGARDVGPLAVAGTQAMLDRLTRSTARTTVWRPEEVGSLEPALVDRFASAIVDRFPDLTAKYLPEQPEQPEQQEEPAQPAREMSLAEIRAMLAAQRGDLPSSLFPESSSASPPPSLSASPPSSEARRHRSEPESPVTPPAGQAQSPAATQVSGGTPPRVLGRRRRRATVEYVTPQGTGTIAAGDTDTPAKPEPPSPPPPIQASEDEGGTPVEPELSPELPPSPVLHDDPQPPVMEPESGRSRDFAEASSLTETDGAESLPAAQPELSRAELPDASEPAESLPVAQPEPPRAEPPRAEPPRASEPSIPRRQTIRPATPSPSVHRRVESRPSTDSRARVDPVGREAPAPSPSAGPESGSTVQRAGRRRSLPEREEPSPASSPPPVIQARSSEPDGGHEPQQRTAPAPSARPSERESEAGSAPVASPSSASASEESDWDVGSQILPVEPSPPVSAGPAASGLRDQLGQEMTFRSPAPSGEPASLLRRESDDDPTEPERPATSLSSVAARHEEGRGPEPTSGEALQFEDEDRPVAPSPSPRAGLTSDIDEPPASPALQRRITPGTTDEPDDQAFVALPPTPSRGDPGGLDLTLHQGHAGRVSLPVDPSPPRPESPIADSGPDLVVRSAPAEPRPAPTDSEPQRAATLPPVGRPTSAPELPAEPRPEAAAPGEPAASAPSSLPEEPDSSVAGRDSTSTTPLSSSVAHSSRPMDDAGNEVESVQAHDAEGAPAVPEVRRAPLSASMAPDEAVSDIEADAPAADRVAPYPAGTGVDRDQAMPLRVMRSDLGAEAGEMPVLGTPSHPEVGRPDSERTGEPSDGPVADIPDRPVQRRPDLSETDSDSRPALAPGKSDSERAVTRPDPAPVDAQEPPALPLRSATPVQRRPDLSETDLDSQPPLAAGDPGARSNRTADRPIAVERGDADRRSAGVSPGPLDREMPLRRAPRNEQPFSPASPPAEFGPVPPREESHPSGSTGHPPSSGETTRFSGSPSERASAIQSAGESALSSEREPSLREVVRKNEADSPVTGEQPALSVPPSEDLKLTPTGAGPDPDALTLAEIEPESPPESHVPGTPQRLGREVLRRPPQDRDRGELEDPPGATPGFAEPSTPARRYSPPQPDGVGEILGGERPQPLRMTRSRPASPRDDEALGTEEALDETSLPLVRPAHRRIEQPPVQDLRDVGQESATPGGAPGLSAVEGRETPESESPAPKVRLRRADADKTGEQIQLSGTNDSAADSPEESGGPGATPPMARSEAPAGLGEASSLSAARQADLRMQSEDESAVGAPPPRPGELRSQATSTLKDGLSHEMPYRQPVAGAPPRPGTAPREESSPPTQRGEAAGPSLRRSLAEEPPATAAPADQPGELPRAHESEPRRVRMSSSDESSNVETELLVRAVRSRLPLTGSLPLSIERLAPSLLLDPAPRELGRGPSVPQGEPDDSGALAPGRLPADPAFVGERKRVAVSLTPRAVTAQMVSRGWRFKQRSVEGSARPDEIRRVVDYLEHPADAGRPLDPGPRRLMEHALGRDFGNVRVHRAPVGVLQAAAATRGRDIYFEPGQDRFDNPESLALLGHELTHVAQSGLAPTRPVVQRAPLPILSLARVEDDELEAEQSERRILDLTKSQPFSSATFSPTELPLATHAPIQAKEQQQSDIPAAIGPQPTAAAAGRPGSTLIQRQVEHPASDQTGVIQRSFDSPEAQGDALDLDNQEPEQQPDLDDLARRIYPLIKRMLAVERERRSSR